MTSLDKIEISIILVFVKSKLPIPENDTLLITLLQNYDTMYLQFCIDQVFGAVAGDCFLLIFANINTK